MGKRMGIVRRTAAAMGMATIAVAAFAVPTGAPQAAAPSPGVQRGVTGLPVPRFVSLKASRVNLRVGPGEDYNVSWVFVRPGLPVEVIQEYDNWRRIRDSDGTVGWVFQSLLSGKRTVVVSPWSKGDPLPIRSYAAPDATVSAYLQPGVMGTVDRCRDSWCRISGADYSGWIPEDQLWGVYQHEEID